MDYSSQIICDLVYNYDRLHDLKISGSDDGATYSTNASLITTYSGLTGPISTNKKHHRQRSPFESSVLMKVDLEKAIRHLTGREKFILLACIYESETGIEYFCDWLGVTPKAMRDMRDQVILKMVSLMNPRRERRGGMRIGAGRPKNQKTKKGF